LAKTPVVLATEVDSSGGVITADDLAVYLVGSDGRILRYALADGRATTLPLAGDFHEALALQASSEGLYVAANLPLGADGSIPTQSKVVLLPTDGGAPRELVTDYDAVLHFALDDDNLYFTGAKPNHGLAGSLVSLQRGTGKLVAETEVSINADLRGVYGGEGIIADVLDGLTLQPFGKGRASGVGRKGIVPISLFPSLVTTVAGDRMVLVQGDPEHQGTRDVGLVVQLVSLEALTYETLAKLALPVEAPIDSVALYGDDIYYARRSTLAGHRKDGALVRMSIGDKHSVDVVTGLDLTVALVVTSRGLVWLELDRSKQPAAARLVLLPFAGSK